MVVDAFFKSPNIFEDVAGIIKIARVLRPMIPKRSWAAPHHKVALAEVGPKEMNGSSLVHYTKAKHARAAGIMLKSWLCGPRQIMFVLQMEC